jgi:hypothetical protein
MQIRSGKISIASLTYVINIGCEKKIEEDIPTALLPNNHRGSHGGTAMLLEKHQASQTKRVIDSKAYLCWG